MLDPPSAIALYGVPANRMTEERKSGQVLNRLGGRGKGNLSGQRVHLNSGETVQRVKRHELPELAHGARTLPNPSTEIFANNYDGLPGAEEWKLKAGPDKPALANRINGRIRALELLGHVR